MYREGGEGTTAVDRGASQLDEPEAIERARRGDAVAFEQLALAHQDLAFRTAYLITGDAAEAEDAAQTGLVKAYYALDRFRPGAPFRPWLLRIVANEARNRRAAAARRPALALDDVPLADPAPSPEALAIASDQRRRLAAAVDRLREEDQTVIAYRYVLDLSEAEMAAALGCRRGTVKSRLSRALGRLREVVAAMDQPPDAPATSREDVR